MKAVPADGLTIRRWQDGAVAYCDDSGDTHLLAAEAGTPSPLAGEGRGEGPWADMIPPDRQPRPATREGEFTFASGPFTIRLRTRIAAVARHVALFYQPLGKVSFADFHLALTRPPLRRWFRPQVVFDFDGQQPFLPLPLAQAPAVLEWGLNWCIAAHVHAWLVLHAAALARNGRALLLPGPPGAGKSTLAAALALSGWELLSDELALVTLDGGAVMPLGRPINLKNDSIPLIRRHFPAAQFGPPMAGTAKGRVALLKPPAPARAPARPAAVVVPRFEAGATARLEPLPKAEACLLLAEHGFDYSILGHRGFEAAAGLADRCGCWRLVHGDVGAALPLLAALLSA